MNYGCSHFFYLAIVFITSQNKRATRKMALVVDSGRSRKDPTCDPSSERRCGYQLRPRRFTGSILRILGFFTGLAGIKRVGKPRGCYKLDLVQSVLLVGRFALLARCQGVAVGTNGLEAFSGAASRFFGYADHHVPASVFKLKCRWISAADPGFSACARTCFVLGGGGSRQ